VDDGRAALAKQRALRARRGYFGAAGAAAHGRGRGAAGAARARFAQYAHGELPKLQLLKQLPQARGIGRVHEELIGFKLDGHVDVNRG
nr:hypothetical protein [Tanacetum cinerariifolium]